MPIEDQVFDEVQAVDLMDDTGRETSQRGQRAYRVLVSCNARVDNPYRVGKRTHVGSTVRSGVGPHAQTPRRRPQRKRFEYRVGGGGCKVVVVGDAPVRGFAIALNRGCSGQDPFVIAIAMVKRGTVVT